MQAVYIGILTAGTTSRMRAEWLRALTPEWTWLWVDTDESMLRSPHLWQTLAFRSKWGPVLTAINAQVRTQMPQGPHHLIWVDKGVFLWRETVKHLRRQTRRLVHFTPDTAFHANRSRHFNRCLGLYDLLVTTKSFEVDAYCRRVDPARVFLTTQGYDSRVHQPLETAGGRRREVAFVGLAEADREHCLGLLLEQGVPVRLAGRGWGRFLKRWRDSPHLHFEGESVFGDAYAAILAGAWVGVGLLSKHFPELHTTRTFEIPACGTILATEDTADTSRCFGPHEAIFFQDYAALAVKLRSLFADASDAELAAMAQAGRRRVLRDGRDYATLLLAVLDDPQLDFSAVWESVPDRLARDPESAGTPLGSHAASRLSEDPHRGGPGILPGFQSAHANPKNPALVPLGPACLTPKIPPELIEGIRDIEPRSRRIERSVAGRDNRRVELTIDNTSPPETKTLCIGFLGADWWGSDARAMAAELRRRGHLVLERHYEDYFPTKWRHPLLKALRYTLSKLMARDYNQSVEELLDVGTLDMLLVFKGMLLEPTTLTRFKAKRLPCYCFYPDVSFFDHGPNIPACLPLYDCIFTSKSYHFEDPALMELATQWRFAPHGFDPEVHRPVAEAGAGLDVYACDLSFVGYWSVKKEQILAGMRERLPDIDLKIWGPGWARAGTLVKSCWQGRGAYGDEAAAIYSLSKINLGLLSEAGTGVTRGDATTARTWQIPGAGGFLLHEDTAEIRASFADDKEVALFDGADQLVAQVLRFMADDGARRAIAAAGHRRAVDAPYTYARAVNIILANHAAREGAMMQG